MPSRRMKVAQRTQNDVDARAPLGVAKHQCRDVGNSVEGKTFADRESYCPPDERLAGMTSPAAAAGGARVRLHHDVIALWIERLRGRRFALGFLEGDDIRVEAMRDAPHRLIVAGFAPFTAGAVRRGDFEITACKPEWRPGCGRRDEWCGIMAQGASAHREKKTERRERKGSYASPRGRLAPASTIYRHGHQ